MITAIKGAAEELIVTRADHRTISILTAEVRPEAWADDSAEIISDTVTVTGVLFWVDIESKGFRIRDDVGNAIILEKVQNIDTAAQLVGGRTSATGTAVRTARGDLRVRFASSLLLSFRSSGSMRRWMWLARNWLTFWFSLRPGRDRTRLGCGAGQRRCG